MIRWATMDDVPRIVEMALSFYAMTPYPDIVASSKEQMAGLAIMMMREHVMLVAERNDEVVGMAALTIEPFIFNPTVRVANELVWWMDESARGGMLAARLLKAIETECKKIGVDIIRMALMADSPRSADGIYRKLGYRMSDSHYEKVM